MKRLLGRRVAVAVVAVVAIAGAGIAYASIPDSNGVIHGCYNADNGGLRVFGKSKDFQQCNAGEKPLDWSQTGPTGPTGATGATGAAGATGPSEGFIRAFVADVPPTGDPVVVTSGADVPAGNYMINGEITAPRLAAGSAEIHCFFTQTGTGLSAGASARLFVSTTQGGSAPFTAEESASGPVKLGVFCDQDPDGTVSVQIAIQINAILVGTVNF